MRYLFMGSPAIATVVLDALDKAGYRPEAVITQTPKPAGRGRQPHATAVATYARKKSWPVHEVVDVNTADNVALMKKYQPDVIIVVAFGQILKQEVLSLPKLCCLNLHASLLPKYRGAAPVQWSILNGDQETGITIQKMVKALDAGDIFIQKKTEISPQDTSESLLNKLAVLGGQGAVEALKKCERGDLIFTPQDPKNVSYAPKISKEQAVIDWNQSAAHIHNQIRGLQPWPVAETRLGNEQLRVFGSQVISKKMNGAPGSIESDGKSYLHVACGRGTALALTQIQLENRKRLAIEDFLRGYQLNVSRFEGPK